MINIEFNNKKFKIYAKGKITSPNATDDEIQEIETIVKSITDTYNPSDGFLVGFIAYKLPCYGIKVISYRDYECENSPKDRIY